MAEAKGVAPKRGPGLEGGVPRGEDKSLRVSEETYRELLAISEALFPAYGRSVSQAEAMDAAISVVQKALRSPKKRASILAWASESPRKTIIRGEEKIIHVSPETYASFIAIMGAVLPGFGRKPNFGEVGALVVRYYREQETKEVSA